MLTFKLSDDAAVTCMEAGAGAARESRQVDV
jgi:hypothetical protein